MKSPAGLRSFAIIAALFAAALLACAGLVAADAAELIIPPPEGTAEQLLIALGAHRYEGAMNQLSSDLREQLRKEDLRAIVESIEQSPRRGIQDAHGQDAQTQGSQASASVEVKFNDNQTQIVELSLTKENGLWKVTDLAPVKALAK